MEEAAPVSAPAYADLGKLAREVFGTSFNFEIGKVHLNTPVKDLIIDAEALYGFKQEKVFFPSFSLLRSGG